MFVTHARTAEELRLEVISDIRRRMANLDSYVRFFAKSEREKAKVARANIELENMLHFWEELVIQGENKTKQNSNVVIKTPNELRAKRGLAPIEDIRDKEGLPGPFEE